MYKKILIGLEIIIILVAAFLYISLKAIPEYKSKLGSSDNLISTKNVKDIIEFKTNNINFAIIIDKKNIISNILFFDCSSIILYNQNIENLDIDKGINKIINILINNNYFQNNSSLELINYNNNSYDLVKDVVINYFTNNSLQINLIESSTSLKEKGIVLNIEKTTNSKELLTFIDFYSKDLIKECVDNKKQNQNQNTLTKKVAVEYANNVYLKIQNYIDSNNIDNLEINNTLLPINLIPLENGKYYPTSDSWYYVKDRKIYAYIKFPCQNTTCSYCYKGSINLMEEGECS